jgi:hypothetical protein
MWIALALSLAPGSVVRASQDAEAQDETVTLVGLSEQGETVVKSIPAKAYTQSIGATLNSVQMSVAPSLSGSEFSSPAPQPWELRTFAVGCTITAQIGLGPIWSISPEARLRIIFSNSKNPVYPD